MKRRTMICAALWVLMAAPGARADKGEGMNVHATLSVDARHDKVLVTFRIENRGERRIGLPRTIAADTEVTGRLFDLREHPGGAEVPYTGPMVKRMALTRADYIELAPHSAHTHTIDISCCYAFKPGLHTYEIRYAGNLLTDVNKLDSEALLATEPVMFAHTQK